MLKIRFKRIGRKKLPSYRLVLIDSKTGRNGRPIEQLGYYNPISKKLNFSEKQIIKYLSNGAQPSSTVKNLLKKSGLIQ